MKLRRIGKSVALVVAAVTLVTACNGDGTSSAPTTTSTTLSQVDLDREKAERIVLTAADVPGFTADPPTPDDEEDASFEESLNTCLDDNALLLRLGEDADERGASSPDFSRGDEQTVSSAVTLGETEDEANSAMETITAAPFAACFSQAIGDELRKDPTFTNVTVNTTRLPALSGGDENVSYRSVVRTRVAGTNLTFNVDFTFIRTGRTFAVLFTFAVGTPFPEAERVRLATLLTTRMAE